MAEIESVLSGCHRLVRLHQLKERCSALPMFLRFSTPSSVSAPSGVALQHNVGLQPLCCSHGTRCAGAVISLNIPAFQRKELVALLVGGQYVRPTYCRKDLH